MKKKSIVLLLFTMLMSMNVMAQNELILRAASDIEEQWPVPISAPGVRMTKTSFQDQCLTISRIINLLASSAESKTKSGNYLSNLMSSKELIQQLAYNMEKAYPGFLAQMAETHTRLILNMGILHEEATYSQMLTPDELSEMTKTIPKDIDASNFLYEIKQRNLYIQAENEKKNFKGIRIEKDKCIMTFAVEDRMITLLKASGNKKSKETMIESILNNDFADYSLFDLDMRRARNAGVKKVEWSHISNSQNYTMSFSEEETEKLFSANNKKYVIFKKSFLDDIEKSMPYSVNHWFSISGIEEQPNTVSLKLICRVELSNYLKDHPEQVKPFCESILQEPRISAFAYLSAFESPLNERKNFVLCLLGSNYMEYTFPYSELVRNLCLEKEQASDSRAQAASVYDKLPKSINIPVDTIDIQKGKEGKFESVKEDKMRLNDGGFPLLLIDFEDVLSDPALEKYCIQFFFKGSTSVSLRNALDTFTEELGQESPSSFYTPSITYRFNITHGVRKPGYYHCYSLSSKIEEKTSTRTDEAKIIFDVASGKVLSIDDVVIPEMADFIKSKADQAVIYLSMSGADELSIHYKQGGSYQKIFLSLSQNRDLLTPYFRVLTGNANRGYINNNGEVLKAKEVVVNEKPSKDPNKVYDVVEKMPEFAPCTYEVPVYNEKREIIGVSKKHNPGGQEGLLRFISDNLKYPTIAEENGIQGRVVCTFVIERDGSVSDVQVARSIDPSLDKEAVRVLKKMPRWNPGKQKGQPVRVKYTVPVTFKLQ